MDEQRLRRARSFGGVADEYERARPGYPEDAVRWLVGERPRRVVDVGAGTGKLTRQLVALSREVIAVDPSAEMLERLRAAVPGATVLVGTAEEIPLENESVDVAVAAQAFHWFDHPVALAEIARVLRPGGTLGLVWNMRDDSVGWVARLSQLLGGEGFRSDERPIEPIEASGRYGPVAEATFRLEQPLSRAELVDLASSRSYVATLEPDARADLLDGISALYDEVEDEAGIVLPYVTHAYRASRL